MTDLKDKAINIKGSEYVLVKDRILAFNTDYPNGSIVTELVSYQNGQMIVKAKVTPDLEKSERFYTGHSQAVEGQGYINKTSALENAETSAVGRALAMMGIGVIDAVASLDEMYKAGAVEDKGKPSEDPEWIANSNEEARPCRTCGAVTTFKTGTSKAGKTYRGYFCTADKEHKPEWLYN